MLREVSDPKEVLVLHRELDADTHVFAYRLDPAEVVRLNAFRDALKKKQAASGGSGGSLTIAIRPQACRSGELPRRPVMVTTYLRTAETGGYVPLARDLDLRTIDPKQIWPPRFRRADRSSGRALRDLTLCSMIQSFAACRSARETQRSRAVPFIPGRPIGQRWHSVRSPPLVITATRDPIQKCRVGPIARRGHQSMFDWVDVDVIEVRLEISLVANGVFPESPLPDALFAFGTPALAPVRKFMCLEIGARERLLDQAPSGREIRVAIGQRPERMEMVGKYNVGIDLEGMTRADLLNGPDQERYASGSGNSGRLRSVTKVKKNVAPAALTRLYRIVWFP